MQIFFAHLIDYGYISHTQKNEVKNGLVELVRCGPFLVTEKQGSFLENVFHGERKFQNLFKFEFCSILEN